VSCRDGGESRCLDSQFVSFPPSQVSRNPRTNLWGKSSSMIRSELNNGDGNHNLLLTTCCWRESWDRTGGISNRSPKSTQSQSDVIAGSIVQCAENMREWREEKQVWQDQKRRESWDFGRGHLSRHLGAT
jgi:hypothetical protein